MTSSRKIFAKMLNYLMQNELAMQNHYVKSVVLPYFRQFVESNLNVALFDLDGKVLEISKLSAQTAELEYEEVIGKSYANLTPEIIKRSCHVDDVEHLNEITLLFRKIHQIQQLVISEKIAINYVDFIRYKNSFSAELVTHSPIFDYEGNVVATQALATKHYMFGILDYLNTLTGKNASFHLYKIQPKIDLSDRQHEILFLMVAGMRRNDICSFLGIRPGTLSKTVARLCQKFGIVGIFINELLDKVRSLGIHQYIPRTLNKPRLIILDPRIRQKITLDNE